MYHQDYTPPAGGRRVRGVGLIFYTPGSPYGITANTPTTASPLPTGPIAYRPSAPSTTAPLILPVQSVLPPSVVAQPAAAAATPSSNNGSALASLQNFLQSQTPSSPPQPVATNPLEGPVSNADGTPAGGGFPVVPVAIAVALFLVFSRR